MVTEEIKNLCVVCHKPLHKLLAPTIWQLTVVCRVCGLLYTSDSPGISPEDPRYESYVGKTK